jgi:hypothetical protein
MPSVRRYIPDTLDQFLHIAGRLRDGRGPLIEHHPKADIASVPDRVQEVRSKQDFFFGEFIGPAAPAVVKEDANGPRCVRSRGNRQNLTIQLVHAHAQSSDLRSAMRAGLVNRKNVHCPNGLRGYGGTSGSRCLSLRRKPGNLSAGGGSEAQCDSQQNGFDEPSQSVLSKRS